MKQSLVFLCFGLISLASAARDATREEKAYGKDVAETVVRQITRSKIFPDDHSFLIRLAYVESRFGHDNHTFRGNYTGGIWQVNEEFYHQTLTGSAPAIVTAVNKEFNINWTRTTWRDLLKPLYSGLAASLYFKLKPAIPDTISEQAAYWKKYYREGGNVDTFKNASEQLRNETESRGKMDLAIVLDGSGNIEGGPFNVA